jgi:alpha-maltose-1-phosphate synthase
MSVVVSHPTGNPFLRAVLRALFDHELLQAFHTTIAVPSCLTSSNFPGSRLTRHIGQRCFPEAGWSNIRLHPFREALRLASRRLGNSSLIRHETGFASVDAVYRNLDNAVAARLKRSGPHKIKAIYAYEDGAQHSFIAAKTAGIKCFYDLPIAHWRTLRRLLEEEAERLPEWASTMEGLKDSATKLERKDAEIEMADRILVASSFTRRSLSDHFGQKLDISVTPYGCPPPLVDHPAERAPGEPLRLFYAGHLAQRKGIADLIAAVKQLDIDWHLTLAGPRPVEAPGALNRFLSDPRCTWLGAIPHQTVLEQMARAHVFVFPSIVEGFGMVITEAMASGVPVITTPNTAGPDIMTEGSEGFIVPIRAPDMLAERITSLADDETGRRAMAVNALETAHRSAWSNYEQQIATLVEKWIAV